MHVNMREALAGGARWRAGNSHAFGEEAGNVAVVTLMGDARRRNDCFVREPASLGTSHEPARPYN